MGRGAARNAVPADALTVGEPATLPEATVNAATLGPFELRGQRMVLPGHDWPVHRGLGYILRII